MTRRYVTQNRPRAYWCDDLDTEMPMPPTMFIVEAENEPVDIGIVDCHGTPIYRIDERKPIGFKVKA